MRTLLYHAIALASSVAIGCGTPAPSPAPPSTSIAPAPAQPTTTAPDSASATVQSIARAKAILDRVRAAAGGEALASIRSLQADGTSSATFAKQHRRLTVTALFPDRYKQDETPLQGPRAADRFRTTVVLNGEMGWFAGVGLGGEGQSRDRDVRRRAYTRAARQSMIAFFSGVNLGWLTEPGRLTFTDGGTVDSGDDRGALVILIDGPEGRAGRLIIDPGTMLPRRFITPPQPAGGTASVLETVLTFSDFQPQAGTQLPRTFVRVNGQNRTTWTITKYTINPKLTTRNFLPQQRPIRK